MQGIPVNHVVAVKELQGARHLRGVKTSSRLLKLPGSLNLEHQVPAVHVLHDEEQSVLRQNLSINVFVREKRGEGFPKKLVLRNMLAQFFASAHNVKNQIESSLKLQNKLI